MKIVEAMHYGHDWKQLLEFIEFWIKSDGFGEDREKDNLINRRKTQHTVTLHFSDDYQLEIIKDVVFPDERPRELKPGETFIQENLSSVMNDVEQWLQQMAAISPEEINRKRFYEIERNFSMVGIGFFLKTTTITDWGLRVSAIKTNVSLKPKLCSCITNMPPCENALCVSATNIGIPK